MTSTDDALHGAQKSVVPTAAMLTHLPLPPTPHGIAHASVAVSMTHRRRADGAQKSVVPTAAMTT